MFPNSEALTNGLNIVAGVALLNTLKAFDISAATIKWPNDILWDNKKLAGVLIETGSINQDSSQNKYAIIGIGLNLFMPTNQITKIDQPAIDLATICTNNNMKSLNKSDISDRLLEELTSALNEYTLNGTEKFVPMWLEHDVSINKKVTVGTHSGIARGVSRSGALLLEVKGELKEVMNGSLYL